MTTDNHPQPDLLFREGGELGALMRDLDWASTPLGPPSTWPAALRTSVHLMLASKQPMYLAWTPDLIALYNDAYRPILGADKHPAALGARTADIFGQDGYPGLKPVFDAALRGESAAFENLLVPLVRHGYLEECYFDVGYTPVYVDQHVEGVFSSVTETTERVLLARRTRTLAALTAALLGAAAPQQVMQAARTVAEDNPHDLPCLLLYVPTAGGELHLVGAAGLSDEQTAPWHHAPHDWLKAREEQVIPVQPFVTGPWPEPVTQLAVLPLTQPEEAAPLGLLAVGINPRKHLDDAYWDFLHLFSGQLAAALRTARLDGELRQRNAELDARNRALDAFEEWTRDLTIDLDPDVLVGRAQAMIRSLIPLDAAVYYEREGERWFVRRMLGEYGSAELRRAHEQGLPHASTGNLRTPFETGQPYYQEVYDENTDHLAPHTAHVTATAMVPLRTTRGVRGIFGLAAFGRSGWTAVDRTVIETVGRSLSLALDRAEQVAELARERERLAGQTAALASANEELEAFAYSVSHDLRTPVRHIQGFNALLRKSFGAGLDSRATRYLEVVDQAAVRMNTLIDAMLDLSRTSRQPLRVGVVDLGALVASVREEVEVDVLERLVTWHVQPLPLVAGDHNLLRQVVQNLLSNALKYTRNRADVVIEVWAEERPDEWAVFVRDNGVGFDPRYQDKLFGVFQRLHRADEFEGIGVGLANVRRIIARHGGQVTAHGAVGEGATFGFTLPSVG
ncbi:sensor histidine kinase [Deinococcus humi]|uniref:histidine kinase n=1 Tax=Deinococcus humi TaxID=662880 RepID=A0A7W8NJR3_9DEIO|nr:ATP-binding protein [Deinococcus humi]MBB5366377.1 signal transduction histidine kinase [Deinococcus humi]